MWDKTFERTLFINLRKWFLVLSATWDSDFLFWDNIFLKGFFVQFILNIIYITSSWHFNAIKVQMKMGWFWHVLLTNCGCVCLQWKSAFWFCNLSCLSELKHRPQVLFVTILLPSKPSKSIFSVVEMRDENYLRSIQSQNSNKQPIFLKIFLVWPVTFQLLIFTFYRPFPFTT